jgi:hypothetical protein
MTPVCSAAAATAASRAAAVAQFLGHTVATHLQFYVRSTDDSLARAAVTFGAVLAAASGS